MDNQPPSPGFRRIRVVIVCPGGRHFEGGISRAVDYLVNAWEHQDHAPEVRIVDPRGTRGLLWSPLYLARAVAVVSWLFTTGKADLLHINVSIGASTARKSVIALLASLLRAPYLMHIHSGRYDRFYRGLPSPLRGITRRILNRAVRIIVLGTQWRDFVRDEVGIAPNRVVVMHNAVPGPAAIHRQKPPSEPPKILFLGRLSQGKGVPELLQALAMPRLASLPWTATLAGDGDVDDYGKRGADLGIGDRIALPGWVGPETVRQLLQSADIMVLPSHHEGLPMSILEGMAYGLAIVTTPVGAIGEAVDDGVSGLMVPPGNAEALADALARVVADANLRRSLSDAARDAFLQGFDVETYASRLAALYAQCLSEIPD